MTTPPPIESDTPKTEAVIAATCTILGCTRNDLPQGLIGYAEHQERHLNSAKSRAEDDAKRLAELEAELGRLRSGLLEIANRGSSVMRGAREAIEKANLLLAGDGDDYIERICRGFIEEHEAKVAALQAAIAKRDRAIHDMRDAINAALHTGDGCALDSNQRLNLQQCLAYVPHPQSAAPASTGEGGG